MTSPCAPRPRRCRKKKWTWRAFTPTRRRAMAETMNAAAQDRAKEMRVQEALREALRYEMARDERVFVMGEDVALFGGAYGVTRGLLQEFGEGRVLDTPISESALVGLAAGDGSACESCRAVSLHDRRPGQRADGRAQQICDSSRRRTEPFELQPRRL